MKIHYLIKMVLSVGVDEFWKWHGHEPTTAELGELWIQQKTGDFAFQMLAKTGFYLRSIMHNDHHVVLAQTAVFAANMHKEIAAYVQQNSAKHYRVIGLQYGIRSDHPAGYYEGACRVLLPYALPYIQEFAWKDLRTAMGYSKPDDLETFYIAREIAPVDFPLFAKQQIAGYFQNTYDDRGMALIEAVIGSGAHQTVLWVDTTEKLRIAKQETIERMYEILGRYEDKALAREYFQYYLTALETEAGEAIKRFAEYDKEMAKIVENPVPFHPDPGVLDLMSLLHNSEGAIPEDGTSRAIKALDEFYTTYYGR